MAGELGSQECKRMFQGKNEEKWLMLEMRGCGLRRRKGSLYKCCFGVFGKGMWSEKSRTLNRL